MKLFRYFVFLGTIGILLFAWHHEAKANDGFYAMTHGEQDMRVLAKIISREGSTAYARIFYRFPDNKVTSTDEIEIRNLQAKGAPYSERYTVEPGKNYFLFLNKKENYFFIHGGAYEIRGTDPVTAKFVHITYPNDAAVQWFMNSNGMDKDFDVQYDVESDIATVYVRTAQGNAQIYQSGSEWYATPEVVIPLAIIVFLAIFLLRPFLSKNGQGVMN